MRRIHIRTYKSQDDTLRITYFPRIEGGYVRLLIATPAYGGLVTTPYLLSLLDTYTYLIKNKLVDEVQVHTLSNESLISRGRNKCARYALLNGYDKMLFIDADMAWRAEDVELLLRSDKPIIGGTYPMKCFPVTLNFNPLPEGNDTFGTRRQQDNYFEFIKKHASLNGEVEVKHIPTGFMLIDTKVFLSLASGGKVAEYETFQPDNNTVEKFFDFFPVRVKDGKYESEDWAFCSIAREAGFPVYLQTKIVTAHVGTHIYALGQHHAIGQKPIIPEGTK